MTNAYGVAYNHQRDKFTPSQPIEADLLVQLVGQSRSIIAPEFSAMTLLCRSINYAEDFGGALFHGDRSEVFKLRAHIGCSGSGHIGSDNSGTTLSANPRSNILDRKGNDIIHLLIDFLCDKVGTRFTDTVSVERVRQAFFNLPSSTRDDDEFRNLGRFQERSECLEEN